MNENKRSVFAGILGDNAVLSGLMVISPVIVCGDHIRNALVLIYAFSTITFLSVIISSFVPRKLPYAVKITIYAVISSLVYLPVRTAADTFFPDSVDSIGIYFPLLAVNSFIVFQSEVRFFRMPRVKMTLSLLFYIIGFDAVMLITAFIRELFAYGTINSKMADADTLISGLGEPFGGFIFLGLMCGVYRKIRSMASRSKNTARGETDASGK